MKPHLLMCAVLATGCVFRVYDPGLVPFADGGAIMDAQATSSRVPPARPDVADAADAEEVLFGLRAVQLDQEGEAWREIGYDLDGINTQEPDLLAECTPPRMSEPPLDGEAGVDNTFGAQLFPLVDLAVMGVEEAAQVAEEQGRAPVVRVRGWNGQDDDPRVDVVLSDAVYTVPEMGGVPHPHTVEDFEPVDGGARVPFPSWDGTDYAFLRAGTFVDGNPDLPLSRDDNAYVAGRVLVARLPDRVELTVPGEGVSVLVRLTDGVLTGTISDDGLTLEETFVAGRWGVLDFLDAAERFGVCRGTASYDILNNQLDALADIRLTPGTGGDGVSCDAVSVGIGFTGTRVRFGGLTPGAEPSNVCSMP